MIVLEAVAHRELWIWACHFGKIGCLNDVKVLNSSLTVEAMVQSKMLPNFEYTVNDRRRNEL